MAVLGQEKELSSFSFSPSGYYFLSYVVWRLSSCHCLWLSLCPCINISYGTKIPRNVQDNASWSSCSSQVCSVEYLFSLPLTSITFLYISFYYWFSPAQWSINQHLTRCHPLTGLCYHLFVSLNHVYWVTRMHISTNIFYPLFITVM